MTETKQIIPKACKFEESRRISPEPEAGLTELEAVKEARRCLGNHFCTRNPATGHIEIDLEFCKGCGICAFICPRKAIRMEREE